MSVRIETAYEYIIFPAPLPFWEAAGGEIVYSEAAYWIIFRYLYTVGLLRLHTLASSLMFIFPAAYVG